MMGYPNASLTMYANAPTVVAIQCGPLADALSLSLSVCVCQFQFVNFNEVLATETPDVAFALRALMEIPEQYKSLGRLNVFRKRASK
jgi:hypothetical protein